MEPDFELSVVVYKGKAVWVAQCLEHDIAAFAEDPGDLPLRLERVIRADLIINRQLGRAGLDGIPPAPERFRTMDVAFRVKPTEGPWTVMPI